MSGTLTPSAWKKLIDENIDWLINNSPDCAEQYHIKSCLEHIRDNKPKFNSGEQ